MKIRTVNCLGSFDQVRVVWYDTARYEGWFKSLDDIPVKPTKMESTGWEIHNDENVVVLAVTISQHNISDLLVIPKRCIEEIDRG